MNLCRLAYRLSTLAAMAAVSGASLALAPPRIDLDRAHDSPTLTVRYTGARVALIELKINGRSSGFRDMTVEASSGETTFDIDAALLEDGENTVEVLLYDADGKVLGSQRTVVVREPGEESPVTIATPRPGATVQGPVEIRVGVHRHLRGIFVSFFINDEFRLLRNFPPYSYLWDTTRVPNGWHDLEAWVVDDANQTFRTRRVRVFVNNPGGRTEREAMTPARPAAPPAQPAAQPAAPPPIRPSPAQPAPAQPTPAQPAPARPAARPAPLSPAPAAPGAAPARTPVPLTPADNPLAPGVTGAGAGVRPMVPGGSGSAVAPPMPATAPAEARATTPGAIRGQTGPMAGTKPTRLGAPVAAGPKLLTPQELVAKVTPAPAPGLTATRAAGAQVELVRITYGQRLSGVTTFAVLLNRQIVDFDVPPRVEGGIPLTPFRHLLESAGGEVRWAHDTKTVQAFADGQGIVLRIGDRIARIGDRDLRLELAPFIERGRTIVPLSFIGEALRVEVDYDPATGHVLIRSRE
jgi:hypothetical protein